MPSSAVLVPLYIYPFPGAWTPLYHAIEANPSTQFLVIINPGNGPGPSSLPDANYCHEIPKLRSHSNVAVFGYVHVSWGRRDLDEVRRDVEIYAAWPEHQHDTFQPPCQDQNVSDTRLAIDGIFVDETPILAHEHEVSFLGSLTSLVHSIWPSVPALTSGTPVSDLDSAAKVPTVIHNPGCMPPPAIRELADLCVVFEDTHASFLARLKKGVFALPKDGPEDALEDAADCGKNTASEQVGVQTAATTEQPPAEATNSHPGPWEGSASSKSAAEKERLRRAVVVHSVTLPKRRVDEGVAQTEQEEEDKRRTAEVRNLVSQASQVAGAVFVTELSSGFYESFSRGWREWAGVIGAEEQ